MGIKEIICGALMVMVGGLLLGYGIAFILT